MPENALSSIGYKGKTYTCYSMEEAFAIMEAVDHLEEEKEFDKWAESIDYGHSFDPCTYRCTKCNLDKADFWMKKSDNILGSHWCIETIKKLVETKYRRFI